MLNKFKYLAGALFSIGCFLTWISLTQYLGFELISDSVGWKWGTLISVAGFCIFFSAWLLDKKILSVWSKIWFKLL